MDEITLGVNWLAVAVGAFLSFLMGWLWFSPKFLGKSWAAGVGIDIEAADNKPPAEAMVTQLLGTIMLAWLVGITAVTSSLLTLLLVVITFTLLSASQGLFIKKSAAAILIEQGCVIAMAIIMVVVQGVL
ncbi:DUF1761 domain-containing protein [Saccharophagus degradans]|uniref:DUF1761 domain-containing protein n=1 Tax=Saccharophagus degradans TaxID=86304 RepID=A0AAW7X6W6_9GAMM|nr:DUF1761 domain-containing protein [Saccharophagus degradans]MDO6423585.1 DUF1761 domain-containing protein [Saccharophagus degradans]MDO6607743.1 DUF1761 domain-containing protein [Saccharophagus degradans]